MTATPIESDLQVPGGSLRYRLAGQRNELPVLLFENGWGASLDQWAWYERELADHVRLLSYDRGGIGGSTLDTPQTVSGLTGQIVALLERLKIERPIIVGHSYGGLMGALHIAQQPQAFRGLVQLDNTPERAEPVIDKQLGAVHVMAKLAIACARIGIPDPLFSQIRKKLPAEPGRQLQERAMGSAVSLHNALAELKLIVPIRAAIAKANVHVPRIVVSADVSSADQGGAVMRLFAPPARARAVLEIMQRLHQQQASAGDRWEALPFTHGDLAFSPEGAKAMTPRLLDFARSLTVRNS